MILGDLHIDGYLPIGSMYGISTYIHQKNQPNVGRYTIHGWVLILAKLHVVDDVLFLKDLFFLSAIRTEMGSTNAEFSVSKHGWNQRS